MAPTEHDRVNAPSKADGELFALRARAQRHLEEINTDLELEQNLDEQRQKELQSESHVNRLAKTRATAAPRGESDGEQGKKGRLRSAQDVLNRLVHDPQYADSITSSSASSTTPAHPQYEYRIGYLERFSGIMTLPLSEFASRSKAREFEEEDWIPLHRVRCFQRRPRQNGVAASEIETEIETETEDTQSVGGVALIHSTAERDVGIKEQGDRWQTIWDRERRIDLVFGSG